MHDGYKYSRGVGRKSKQTGFADWTYGQIRTVFALFCKDHLTHQGETMQRTLWTAIAMMMVLGSVFALDARRRVHDGHGVLSEAKKYLGVPYRYGGNSPDGFDCSGYTGYVYKKLGLKLARSASDQYKQLRPVRVPSPGDLVFFKTSGARVSHVGIYAGNYRFIHAPSSGKKVSFADIRGKYWKTRYAGARSAYR